LTLTLRQARNQLGTPGGEEFSERGPNFLNYVQNIFPGAGEIFSRGASPPCTPWLRSCTSCLCWMH